MNGRQKRTPKVDSDKGSCAEFNAKKQEKIEANRAKEKPSKKREKRNPSSQQKMRTLKEKGELWFTK